MTEHDEGRMRVADVVGKVGCLCAGERAYCAFGECLACAERMFGDRRMLLREVDELRKVVGDLRLKEAELMKRLWWG